MSYRRISNAKASRAQLARNLAAYSTAAVATTLLVERADAAVVLYSPPGGPQTIEDDQTPLFVDLNGDLLTDFEIAGYFGFYMQSSSLPYLGLVNLVKPDAILNYMAAVVPAGETVGPDVTGWLNYSIDLDTFTGLRGYLGVQFEIPGSTPHFGYLDVEINAANTRLTVYGGAYESEANTPITTPVPEPSGLALLAAGAAGLAAWRRRRSSRAE